MLTCSSSFISSRQKQFNILKPYLPKYFSSEWSHSQFRLPPPAPTASRLPFSLSNVGDTGRSTPTVEDDTCICAWIEVDREEDDQSDSATSMPIRNEVRESRKGKEREHQSGTSLSNRFEKENSSRSSSGSRRSGEPYKHEVFVIPTPPIKRKEFQIVAITHSGGWFRISLGSQPSASKGARTPSFGLGKDSTSDCQLQEYRRFGSKDGW